MTTNRNDIWQIAIVTDTNRSIFVTINKNETVATLFAKFREKYEIVQDERRVSFLAADGVELEQDDGRRLVDVGCLRDKCNIQLIIHADGGGWPTESEVTQRVRNPTKIRSLARRITTSQPDIMGLDDVTPRVKMSCGHAIEVQVVDGPDSIEWYGPQRRQCAPLLDEGLTWDLRDL